MVSNSIIMNFSSVENPLKTSKISIGVAYGSDVSQVIDLMQKAVLSVEKKSKDLLIDLSFQPTVNFTDFGDSALKFTLIFKHKNLFSGQVETAVREEIFGLFNKNKIEIPYPIQTIKLEKS
jgi:small-conductance mechanosensitive channel